jgi:hypothetical protein
MIYLRSTIGKSASIEQIRASSRPADFPGVNKDSAVEESRLRAGPCRGSAVADPRAQRTVIIPQERRVGDLVGPMQTNKEQS